MTPNSPAPRNVLPAEEPSPPSKLLLALLLVVFAVGFLFVLPNVEKFRADERFYTDAAIQMIDTGDYWTPVFADGRLRLQKPVLTYWAVAGPFRLFGINLFAARVISLGAGVLTIFVTYLLALVIFKSRLTALLAALMIASNHELMTMATRATPDALLCLFVLVSMYGFAAIWFASHPSPVAAWLAIGGMALAVETKGLPGLTPLAANALFWLWVRPDGARTRKLANWPAIVFSLVIGLAWYALMLHRHGLEGLQLFFDDQVGEKVSRSPLDFIVNFAVYLTAPLRTFLPWSLLLLAALILARREVAAFLKNHRAACVFLSCLFMVLVVGFSFGNMRRTRYLLAAYPMLAVLLAPVILMWLSKMGFRNRLRVGVTWVALATGLVGFVILVFGLMTSAQIFAAGVVLAGLGVVGILIGRAGSAVGISVWVAVLSILTCVISIACLWFVIWPSQLPAVAAALQQMGGLTRPVSTWKVSDGAAAQLRLLSAGRLKVGELASSGNGPDLSAGSLILTTSPHQQLFERAGFQTQRAGSSHTAFSAVPWLGRLIANFSPNRRPKQPPEYWIVVRVRPAMSSSQ